MDVVFPPSAVTTLPGTNVVATTTATSHTQQTKREPDLARSPTDTDNEILPLISPTSSAQSTSRPNSAGSSQGGGNNSSRRIPVRSTTTTTAIATTATAGHHPHFQSNQSMQSMQSSSSAAISLASEVASMLPWKPSGLVYDVRMMAHNWLSDEDSNHPEWYVRNGWW